jgi:hypothetical protein
LASSPDGLELNDLHAITIVQDVGLEVQHIELLPQDKAESKP